MDVRGEMLRKLLLRRRGYSLDRSFYVDPDFYRVDLELIYYREWLFAGHDCELKKTGSYITLQVGDYPVIIVRDAKGEIRAFHNSCRHRGSRLCSAERGTTAKLVCPYHQWTYELDGRLLYARDMGPSFDPARFGLKPVHCESIGGFVFICVADEAPDLAPLRAMVAPYLLPHRLQDAKIAHETTIIEKGNWKLVWENNRECYHCAGSHPELCRTFPEKPTVTGIDAAEKDPEIAGHWNRCEAAGLPSRFRISDDGQYRAARMPLLRDAVSYTLSGRSAVSRPLSDDVTTPQIGSMMLFHYPSTWNHVLGDHAVSFRVMPISATETAVTTKWLVNKDAVEGVDYDLDELTRVWIATNDQDRQIVEENQRGILSPAYEPGPYSELHEGGVIQFVDWYCSFMQPRVATSGVPLVRVA
ncbi:aromatic ring-hydroxylating oxygenase subunit alpha [Mangrovicella endophytica]|uniref:aromatic ring-hydroxylating oxygenase subunit alpha n=1 Tax=Mangrovicella endophytica TaxID=2066697 RepID=UPI000C9E7397|nr:aromatic ring-hydroxylating dioxygenase subunit alpha [Mangrovicella endophytica]